MYYEEDMLYQWHSWTSDIHRGSTPTMIAAISRPRKNPKIGVYYFRQKVPADLRKLVGMAAAGWLV